MKLLGLLATAASIAGGTALIDQVLPDATRNAGEMSIQQVANAAYQITLLESQVSWPEALGRAREDLRNGYENITITGTTIRWEEAGYCYQSAVPTPESRVAITSCEASAQQP